MPVVTDPSDEIREILIRYAAGEIGPPGADHEIMKILRMRGHVTLNKSPADAYRHPPHEPGRNDWG